MNALKLILLVFVLISISCSSKTECNCFDYEGMATFKSERVTTRINNNLNTEIDTVITTDSFEGPLMFKLSCGEYSKDNDKGIYTIDGSKITFIQEESSCDHDLVCMFFVGGNTYNWSCTDSKTTLTIAEESKISTSTTFEYFSIETETTLQEITY